MGLIDPLVGAFVTHLVVEKGLSTNTFASYKRDLEKYCIYLRGIGHTELVQVTEQDVSKSLVYLTRGDKSEGRPTLAPASVTRSLFAVRSLHKLMAGEGALDMDAVERVASSKRPSRYPKVFSIDEVTRLIESISDDSIVVVADLRSRALAEFLYSTSTRVSEVTGPDIDDADHGTNLMLLCGKGGKERTVPVGSPAMAALGIWLTRGRPGWMRANSGSILLINSLERRLSWQSAGNTLAELNERTGLKMKVSPHTLRHSFGTYLIEGGAGVHMIRELLGYASVTTTQIYTMIIAENMRRVWARAHPRAEYSR